MGITDEPTAAVDAGCLNCGARLTGAFCAECGQKVLRTNPTVMDVARAVAEELTDLDGKFPRSMQALLTKPGLLTEDWLAGRRARWWSPVRLYLVISALYFLSGPVIERLTGVTQKQIATVTVTDESVSGGMRLTPEAEAEILSSELGRRVFEMVGRERMNRIIANPAAVNDAIAGALPKAMFVLLPLFAFLTWLAWYGGGMRFPAHLYFALHLHAAMFASFVVTRVAAFTGSTTVNIVVASAAIAYTTWYAGVAIKRVLGGSTAEFLVKTAVVGAVYAICFFAVTALVSFAAIMQF